MTVLVDAFPSQGSRPFLETVDDGLTDIELLHRISIDLIAEQDSAALYGKIVDAAVAITGSQFGTMQLLLPRGHASGHGGELQLLCSRGFSPENLAFWQWVSPAARSSCTLALKLGQRAVIPDFEEWAEIAGSEDLVPSVGPASALPRRRRSYRATAPC
ncbi:hypothetical protein ACIQW5_20760 [Methylorubrum thiocyanatum]|jgi:hypothetical protein|uniref:hypothetical protein n=1 Tax=Methylorubrum thiocyanatum TaxID=47958 RepID=UPI00383BBE84